jgi:Response regulator containing a CheY-like receiver domain and an HD-GYP domain
MTTVLIIDEQFSSRKILEGLVHTVDENAQVRSFASPTKALDWAKNHPVDLVLTDIQMPSMNGVEFTRWFRRLPDCSDVPLIAITVMDDMDIRYRALEAGATDFLKKPVDHHEFRARCRNLLALRHQQQIIKDRAQWLESKVKEATRELHEREQETLLRLARAGEYRDQETGNHVLRMARYSRVIAEAIGLPEARCESIEAAAPMHDIGKIGVPDRILLKPGQLTAEEFEIMKQHTWIGYEILRDSPSKYLQMGAVIALLHHEKYDGSGYPQGLRGEEIPLPARIVTVADVYDALTSVRPYKTAWSTEHAIAYIKRLKGRHFDPNCVDAFMSQIDRVVEIGASLKDVPDPDLHLLPLTPDQGRAKREPSGCLLAGSLSFGHGEEGFVDCLKLGAAGREPVGK